MGKIYLTLGQTSKAKSHLETALIWMKKSKKMGEPYFERFDEVFEYQITNALDSLSNGQ
ncbi:MAG: hypothetical protein IPO92_14945 [Saprospiraceae bacterium]|nr:hypothetical protein [Saprospiraceae bacterium]